jgi:PA14 domain/Dolichyl-phosphate-mannose-protein mannosyltransferase
MRRPRPSRSTIVFLLAIVTVALFAMWSSPAALPTGLVGRYYANTDWAGPPVLERIDTVLTTQTMADRPELRGLPAFSVEWSGFLIVHESGLHRVATKSDDGTWLWIDDQLVVDNGGLHVVATVTAEVQLSRGVHAFRVRFLEGGGGFFLQVGKTSAGGRFVEPGPLTPYPIPYWRVRAIELWPLALVGLWYATLASVAAAGLRRWRNARVLAELSHACSDRMVLVIVVLGMVVSAAHIGYSLPALESFSPDELSPMDTLAGSREGFRYWNPRWPPLHAYLVAGVLQPFDWARVVFGLPLMDRTVHAAMLVVARGLSVAMLGAASLLVFDLARDIGDRVAGYFSAALLAFSPVAAYFGSLAHLEVPHLFWVTATLWGWFKLARYRDVHWFAVFGALVGASVATKDQAYGFYLAAPAALIVVARQDRREVGLAGWLRAVMDRRVLAAAGATVVVFAIGHGLQWRLDRFIERIGILTGVASAPFQAFPATLEGHARLLGATAKSFVWAAGIPLAIAFAGGCLHLMRTGRVRRLAALLLPPATFYVGFIAVILYVYDRFLIGWLPVAAMVGGVWLSHVYRHPRLPPAVATAVPLTLVGASLLSAVAINVTLHRDPRYVAADWMAANVACGSSVGVSYNAMCVPPLDCYDVWAMWPSQTEGMRRWPDHFVLNDAYIQRFRLAPSGRRFLERLYSGELGFVRVFRADSTPPAWAPLYWESRFWNGVEDPETVLDKALHPIEVWSQQSSEFKVQGSK